MLKRLYKKATEPALFFPAAALLVWTIVIFNV